MRSAEQIEQSQRLIREYLNHLALERRYSSHTIEAAQRDLAEIDSCVLTVGDLELKKILATRHAQGLSAASLARMASSWRGFFAYMERESIRQDNPALALKTPKLAKRLPKALSIDQVQGLVSQQTTDEFSQVQARFLIEFLYCTGLRISEALAIQLSEKGSVDSLSQVSSQSSNQSGQGQKVFSASFLDFQSREVRVTGKGGKTRVVPLVDTLVQEMQGFMEARAHHLKKLGIASNSLFLSARAKSLSVRQAQADVARWAKLNGLNQRLHPHMMRHSFGSHLLQASGNLRAVQELLGHASLASTQVYTSLDFGHLSSVYDQAFPRAKSD